MRVMKDIKEDQIVRIEFDVRHENSFI